MASEAGKGDKQRPTDQAKFAANYDAIFRKPDNFADCAPGYMDALAEKIAKAEKLPDDDVTNDPPALI